MSEVEMFEKIADAVNRLARPAIPLVVDLWDNATVAQYLKRDAKVVRERIAVLLDFPKAIRLSATKGRAHPLNKAAEVIAWAEGHQERRW